MAVNRTPGSCPISTIDSVGAVPLHGCSGSWSLRSAWARYVAIPIRHDLAGITALIVGWRVEALNVGFRTKQFGWRRIGVLGLCAASSAMDIGQVVSRG